MGDLIHVEIQSIQVSEWHEEGSLAVITVDESFLIEVQFTCEDYVLSYVVELFSHGSESDNIFVLMNALMHF